MDTWLNEVQKFPVLYVLCCSVLFRILHWCLQIVARPDTVTKDRWKTWKWRNLSVSLVHSLLTGTWAVACVIYYPAMVHEIHSTYTPSAYMLVVVSSGYFIEDAADIVFSGHAKASWEFLLHHVLVLWCFLYAVFTHQYVAGAVVALFVEVNSVFLHTRLLLNLAKVAHSSLIYTVNKVLNVVTYVTFRLGAQFYLTWYLTYHYSSLDYALYFLITTMLMNIMILIYFYRLIRSDFFTKRRIQNGIQKLAAD
ncbi:TLC domain-containing protein 1 [Danio rerio]|uniref:TLC domain containing 1 n=1 Tax=Danio rerio TaxID=7955 RepID=Q5XJP8_DANRE|nr:TLC domain-containing protein 1 [Danio rerio]AAH83250.1 TLC domain containing 1 [Danio rerio]|eukprot:NP_001006071.1 calfacilitin [Danio rerio]